MTRAGLLRLALALGLLVAGCGDLRGSPRGFYPAIDCQGPFIAADFQARCGPYRGGLR